MVEASGSRVWLYLTAGLSPLLYCWLLLLAVAGAAAAAGAPIS